MAITRLTKHDRHPTSIHFTRSGSKHHAALRCRECNRHIQWLSKQDATKLELLGIEVVSKDTKND
jgi:hypothetical protein